MPAVIVDFDPSTYKRLVTKAEQSGTSVAELVASIVRAGADEADPAFIGLVRRVIDDYRPALNRLAE